MMAAKKRIPLAVAMAGTLLALLVPLCLAGCSGGRKAATAPRPQPQIIPARHTGTVQFPADGRTYDSGFIASPGDTIRFDALGEAASLERGALVFYVGDTGPLRLVTGGEERITRGGQIAFRAKPDLMKSMKGKMIQVKISNMRED
jgi:hypothetical protein